MGKGLLEGQHALVTGGSRGIGKAIAAALASEGATLSLLARRWPAAEKEAAEAAGALCLSADVTSEAECARAMDDAVAAHGPVSILVNNAGGVETAPITRTDGAMVRRMLALNLESAFTLTRLALPGMLDAKAGRIINMASTAGLKGYAYVSAYTAAKHGVVGLTRALAQELGRSGITINAVCPGYTETELVAEAVATIMGKTGRSEAEARAELARSNPQGAMVRPESVAAAVVYLASPAASSVNGVALSISGGETG